MQFFQCRNWGWRWRKLDLNPETRDFGGVFCGYSVFGGDDATNQGDVWWEIERGWNTEKWREKGE